MVVTEAAIPLGRCQCGCGKETRLGRNNRNGNKVGQPQRFVHGHNQYRGRRTPTGESFCKCGKPRPVKGRAKCRECNTEYMREYRQRNPEKPRRWQKKAHFKRVFGITLASYDQMVIEQRGVCAICGEPDPASRALSVDHCHTTGKIRGLLCTLCNTGLGLFKDDPKRLFGAITYLSERNQ